MTLKDVYVVKTYLGYFTGYSLSGQPSFSDDLQDAKFYNDLGTSIYAAQEVRGEIYKMKVSELVLKGGRTSDGKISLLDT